MNDETKQYNITPNDDIPFNWQPGQVIADLYEVVDTTSGGMGAVYFVNHLKWKMKLAVKTPLPLMAKDEFSMKRFIREAETWVDLGLHPHIASCYYVRVLGGRPRIFIEFVDGGSLKEWLKKEKRNVSEIIDVAIQICRGMDYVHEKGVIHRDLKPANCLITKDGIVKVTDFGVVIVGEEIKDISGIITNEEREGSISITGYGLGTPEYMAPEQFEDAKHVGKAADIYSFGVMLFEMVCGKKPFEMPQGMHQRARSMFYKNAHQNDLPADPMSSSKECPSELNVLIKKCLEKIPEKRYATFMDIEERLLKIYEEISRADYPRKKPEPLKLRADSLNNKAASYLDLGKGDDAVRCWQEALKADPQHVETIFNLGYLMWQGNKITRDSYFASIKNLEVIHKTNPAYVRLLAWLYLESGDKEAVESITLSAYWRGDEEFRREYEKTFNDEESVKEIFGQSHVGSNAEVASVCFSPDGKYVLSASKKTIILWEISSGKEIRQFEGHKHSVYCICFSPDGKNALSSSKDKTIRLWEISSGKERMRFEGHNAEVDSVCFSPDGKYVLSASRDKTLRLWEVPSGKEVRKFEGHTGWVNSGCFSPDGRFALSGGGDDTLRLWDVLTGKEVRKFEGHTGWVNSICFSPGGRYVLSGSEDETIRLWEVSSGKEIRKFEGYTDEVTSICFSPDGKYALSNSQYSNNTLRLWAVLSGREIRSLVHTGSVGDACFSPDGRYILSGSAIDGSFKLWRIYHSGARAPFPALSEIKDTGIIVSDSQKALSLIKSARDLMRGSCYREAYNIIRECQLISGYERSSEVLEMLTDCAIRGGGRRASLKTVWPQYSFAGHSNDVTSVCFSPDGMYALSGSWDETLRLWEVSSGKEIRKFEGHTGWVSSVCFSPDGVHALSGSADETIRLWEVSSGKEVRKFEGHTGWVSSICLSPDGKYALSGSKDETLRLWDIASGREIKKFFGYRITVNSICFSPDGKYALSGGEDKTVRLWDVSSGKEVRKFEGHTPFVNFVCFSPDGRRAFSGGGELILREISNGKEIKMFEGHTMIVNSGCFSPDGKYALTGGDDNTLRLWEVISGEEIWKFEGFAGAITSTCFSPDGKYGLSGSRDKTLKLWEFGWEWEFPNENIQTADDRLDDHSSFSKCLDTTFRRSNDT